MGVSLSTLTGRLGEKVPARNGVPADYDQICQEAVLQLGQDVPLIRTATLSIVSGTATYSLPTDFLFLIELEGLASPDGVIIGDSGLIPVSATWEERYYIGGGEITFDPTPTYSVSRDLRYGAVYELDDSNVYQRLTENGARVALLYGQYLALMEQANAVAGNAWRYQIGDEMVDKTKQGEGLRQMGEAALRRYEAAVKPLKAYGSRSRVGYGLDPDSF